MKVNEKKMRVNGKNEKAKKQKKLHLRCNINLPKNGNKQSAVLLSDNKRKSDQLLGKPSRKNPELTYIICTF